VVVKGVHSSTNTPVAIKIMDMTTLRELHKQREENGDVITEPDFMVNQEIELMKV
jgi:hypothetical protein